MKKEFKFQPLQVTVKSNEDVNRMIKRFMKKVRNDGILQELYDRRYYKKPSVKRREKRIKAQFARKLEEKK